MAISFEYSVPSQTITLFMGGKTYKAGLRHRHYAKIKAGLFKLTEKEMRKLFRRIDVDALNAALENAMAN